MKKIDQIRASHKSAQPQESQNPSFFHSHQDLGFVLNLNDELISALEGVVYISDRDHKAWDMAKDVIRRAKGQSCK